MANVLLGGAIGGLAIGHRTADTRRQRRENRRKANRALLFDRLLRHEVINAVTIIGGHAGTLASGRTSLEDGARTVRSAADRITETIEDVSELIEEGDGYRSVDLAAVVSTEIERVAEIGDGRSIRYAGPVEVIAVVADHRLHRVVEKLLSVVDGDSTGAVHIEVADRDFEATLRIRGAGVRLTERQRAILTAGEFSEYDDPSSGFELQIVRLLVREYDGMITLEDDPDRDGETIHISLPKPGNSDLSRSINVTRAQLAIAALGGLAAGAAMGGYLSLTSDLFPVIGALYGLENPLIGWLTHLYHSVIFALIFAAILSHPTVARTVTGRFRVMGAGIVWGVLLWLGAAGLIIPAWLLAIGIPTQIPNLPTLGLVSHVIWGAVLEIGFGSMVE